MQQLLLRNLSYEPHLGIVHRRSSSEVQRQRSSSPKSYPHTWGRVNSHG